MNIERLKLLAQSAGYEKWKHQPEDKLISFIKGSRENDDWVRINVWYTTGTVGTCLTHPIQGKTQLFRRRVNEELLVKILKNPRIHTRVGYKKKNGRSIR